MDKTFDAAEAEARIYKPPGKRRAPSRPARTRKPGAEAFSIMIPPPNVTGVLHVGHAFNNTLQDVLTRWHRMRGFDTLWQPGTDHAGIATQMVVERELARIGNPAPRDGPRGVPVPCLGVEGKSGGTIHQQLKRLGASCDWSREAFTMSGAPGAPEGEDGNFHDAVIKVFVDMYEQGPHLPRQAAGELGPAFRDGDLDLEVENIDAPGPHVALQVPAGGRRDIYVCREGRRRERRASRRSATTSPSPPRGPRRCWATARWRCIPPMSAMRPSWACSARSRWGPKEHRRLIPIITDEYPDPISARAR
jgi:valyl-tRNA synthetase